ncbi:MAG: two-component system sensor histidine kinase KdpD [Burkholderiales bacterium]
MPVADARPDPDKLLERLQLDETKAKRGKLHIFFGASAGVGKTYAMLNAARSARSAGTDVVVGLVETHGRAETAALLEGLEVLPRKPIDHRGSRLDEFDLDAALARHPELILVDELAHSNAPGSRHPKRCQDVEELLRAGINVYTTINVQHLESLNDVVGGITGIRVRETVPDRLFDEADEVVLVDLPPDDLLQRLKEGKVYLPHQAERAVRNFFRKGNLIALRELALRQAADRVDEEVRAYRREKSIGRVWQTQDALLACVGPGVGSNKVVRAAARLADSLDAPWHAVYVETPRLQRLPEAKRRRILGTLKLAEELGAETTTVPSHEIAEGLIEHARSHNISRLVVERPPRPAAGWRRLWGASLSDRLGYLAPDVDVIEIAPEDIDAAAERTMSDEERASLSPRPEAWRGYAWSAGVCVAAAVVASLLFPYFELANIVMVFLLAVVFTAVKLGRGPAVLAAFLSVALFDFFFVAPHFSFAVRDAQYLLTFAVMLAVALVIGQLTAGLRYQAKVAQQRESRARSLYELARELSGAITPEQIAEMCERFVGESFRAKSSLLLMGTGERLDSPVAGGGIAPAVLDLAIAQWVYDQGQPAGVGTDTLPASSLLYLPLKAPMRTRGVLAVEPAVPRWLLVPERRRQLDILATLLAISVERLHYVEVARDALVTMESERLRNSLLSALSHDLRTPLTALVGLADSLALSPPGRSERQSELAAAIREEALRMSRLVNNLLDMARLEAGEVRLNLQWQPVEEVVGSALEASRSLLAGHRVSVRIPADAPLVQFDAVLIERVLCNLFENAAKHTPAGTGIRIAAAVAGERMEIAVADDGPGLPSGLGERIFDKFTRGREESAVPGVGLGLAICRAIVEAHGGTIRAESPREGGARFVFTLPLGTPPQIDEAEPIAAEEAR